MIRAVIDFLKSVPKIYGSLGWLERIRLVLQFMLLFIFIILPFHFSLAFFVWLRNLIGDRYYPLTIMMLVLMGGIAAFNFKEMFRVAYGLIEIIFGMVYAYSVTADLKLTDSMFSRWGTLFGCVYVVTRGLNNIYDSKKK